MHLLVRRFITRETRKRDESGITEDDVMEIRQDISTLRYELIDILKNNGMNTPKLDQFDIQGKKETRISFYSNYFNICKNVITMKTYSVQVLLDGGYI
jgi:hypothetical protein